MPDDEAADYFSTKAHTEPPHAPPQDDHVYPHRFPRHLSSTSVNDFSTPQLSPASLSPSTSNTSASASASNHAATASSSSSQRQSQQQPNFRAPPWPSIQPAVGLHGFLQPAGARGFQLPHRPPPRRGGNKRPTLSNYQAFSHAFPSYESPSVPASSTSDPSSSGSPHSSRGGSPTSPRRDKLKRSSSSYTPYLPGSPSPTFRTYFQPPPSHPTSPSGASTSTSSTASSGDRPPLSLSELDCFGPLLPQGYHGAHSIFPVPGEAPVESEGHGRRQRRREAAAELEGEGSARPSVWREDTAVPRRGSSSRGSISLGEKGKEKGHRPSMRLLEDAQGTVGRDGRAEEDKVEEAANDTQAEDKGYG